MTLDSAYQRLSEAFGPLRAEAESGWLEAVYVRPLLGGEWDSQRSTVLLGESGSGKTTLLRALAQQQAAGPAAYIPVEWRPWLPAADLPPLQLTDQMVEQLFSACAEGLLRWIGQNPQPFGQAKPWAQQGLVGFVRMALQNPLELTLNQLEESSSAAGSDLLRQHFLQPPPAPSFPENVPKTRQTQNLAGMLKALPGVQGLVILADGLETLADLDEQRTGAVLAVFFATLALFENPAFLFKIALPSELEDSFFHSTGYQRRRLPGEPLRWTAAKLQALAEARCRYVLAREDFALPALSPSAALLEHLQRFGGSSPRGWLQIIQPLLAEFLACGAAAPLDEAQLSGILQANPPRLRVDTRRHEAYLGYGKVDGLQPKPLRVLEYLYQQRRPCSHEELYYRACEGLNFVPKTKEEYHGFLYPKEYGGIVDTALWRLRKALEPDPKQPMYIITTHSHGTRLENTW